MNRLAKKLCAALFVLLLLIPAAQADEAAPTLLYMGQASIRIITAEDKVIYIDPYAGDQYDLPYACFPPVENIAGFIPL